MVDRRIIQWDKDDCEALKIVKIDLLGLGMMACSATRSRSSASITARRWTSTRSRTTTTKFTRLCRTRTRSDVPGREPCTDRVPSEIETENFLRHRRPGRDHSSRARSSGTCSSHISRGVRDSKAVTYPHPSLKATLERTLGVPLFQEQLLKIAMDIAGFTGSQAEELRRAMGFKRPTEEWRRSKRICVQA
jgi:error-prone DNA polymerase